MRQLLIDTETTGLDPKQGHRIIEFATPELSALADRICQEHGFDPVSYRFVVYGISPEARKTELAEAGEEPAELAGE